VTPAGGPAGSAAPAGNGVAALSADQILQRATDALGRAGSYRAKGTVDMDGDRSTMDFTMRGADFAGSMSSGTATIDLLAVGGKKYMRPNRAFWVTAAGKKEGRVLADAYRDRWIAGADSDKSFAAIFEVGDVRTLLEPSGALTKGPAKVIDGVPAVGLVDAGDPGALLYVATTGEPYPLQLTGEGGAVLAFSEFGTARHEVAAPPPAKVVHIGERTGK
jgi:hypothetical protein